MAKQEGTGERKWYAIHTYSGYENAVLRNLRQRIDSLNMQDKIFNVLVPPFNVPAVLAQTPLNVCVNPVPKFNVPPGVFIINPAPFTFPVKVAV